MASYTTSVEVYLDQFDEDDIVEHLQENGYTVIKNGAMSDNTNLLDALFNQYRNKDPNLMETLRVYLEEATGRILP